MMHTPNVFVAWALSSHDLLTEAASELGLDVRSVSGLTLLDANDGRTVDWLAPRVGLSQSATVRLVDRLEDAGWVTRRRAGRLVELSSTSAGRALLRRWRRSADSATTAATAGLSLTQLARLGQLLHAALERTPRERMQADSTCRGCDWASCGGDCPVDRSVAVGHELGRAVAHDLSQSSDRGAKTHPRDRLPRSVRILAATWILTSAADNYLLLVTVWVAAPQGWSPLQFAGVLLLSRLPTLVGGALGGRVVDRLGPVPIMRVALVVSTVAMTG
jgi:DNA-binding MarR family transcriptional regulator